MYATVRAIEYHLPDRTLSSEELAATFPDWSVAKIEAKTGIRERRIAAEGECSSDLAVAAAEKLFRSGACRPSDIDYVLLCTQSPDYFLPTTACLLQHRLGIPTSAGALDFNLGCSGFVYGLGLAKALIETGQATNVLLLTAETYSKFIHPLDKSVRTVFGDAAAATLVHGVDEQRETFIGPFVYGTDGEGGKNLIVPAGAMRCSRTSQTAHAVKDESDNWRSSDNLFMNGADIFSFTLRAIPDCVEKLLHITGRTLDDVDWFGNNISMLNPVPGVVTIGDFLSVERPSEMSFARRLYLLGRARGACKAARVLAPISNSTAEAAVRLFGVASERMVVVPNPVDDMYRPASILDVQRVRQQLRLPPEFFLYVAHTYPHKNHVRLFAAYKRFREHGGLWPLVLRGDRKRERVDLEEVARELQIEANVLWLPRLLDDDMVRLYSAASVLIFPSLYEGCGIPVVEAMACGCPVAASNIPTTKEFADGAAVVFDPESVDEMSEVMRRFASDVQLRERCRAEGVVQAHKYSPATVAQRLMKAYRQAVAVRRGVEAVT